MHVFILILILISSVTPYFYPEDVVCYFGKKSELNYVRVLAKRNSYCLFRQFEHSPDDFDYLGFRGPMPDKVADQVVHKGRIVCRNETYSGERARICYCSYNRCNHPMENPMEVYDEPTRQFYLENLDQS